MNCLEMKRKIYVDFDHTLFNTTLFVKTLEKIMLKKIDGNSDTEEIRKVLLENQIDLSQFLYEDVISFLEKYSHEYDLILLSRGNYPFQMLKIEKSKILPYFKGVIITDDYKGLLSLDFKESIFIDDNPAEIESLLKNDPYQVIRVGRGKYKETDLNRPVLTVSNLKEINLLACTDIRGRNGK